MSFIAKCGMGRSTTLLVASCLRPASARHGRNAGARAVEQRLEELAPSSKANPMATTANRTPHQPLRPWARDGSARPAYLWRHDRDPMKGTRASLQGPSRIAAPGRRLSSHGGADGGTGENGWQHEHNHPPRCTSALADQHPAVAKTPLIVNVGETEEEAWARHLRAHPEDRGKSPGIIF
jgi:hypothetical protein